MINVGCLARCCLVLGGTKLPMVVMVTGRVAVMLLSLLS